MATMPSQSVQKFRPYLSLPEIELLLFLCNDHLADCEDEFRPMLESCKQTLMKTKLFAEAGLQTPAYITSPRPTLMDRLGFPSPDTNKPLMPAPDFDGMMEDLANLKRGE